jgi:SAM-dependent methyltransferase
MSMKQLARQWVLPFLDPRKIASFARLPTFFAELRRFRRMQPQSPVRMRDLYPCLEDRVGTTPFDPHYFYQAAWLARRLAESRPAVHHDVGSSVTMLSVLSAHQPVVFLDYRPLQTSLSGLTCLAGSITALPFADASIDSISCLHVIEHIGLGRYGDPLDPLGSRHACVELSRVLRPGGRMYLSVPVGRERICFNAHRVFDPATIVAQLPELKLLQFSLVDDAHTFHPDVAMVRAAGLDYGCGMFEFTR